MKLVQLWKNGPLWADRNLGADKPESLGLFFTWGSTKGFPMEPKGETKSPFDDMDRQLLQEKGVLEGIHLSRKYDAASCMLGNPFRMPTGSELKNLIEKCDWKYVSDSQENSPCYYVVTGKGEYSGNSIILPRPKFDDIFYWSATSGTNPDDARAMSHLWSYANNISSGNHSRNHAMMIRPVVTCNPEQTAVKGRISAK